MSVDLALVKLHLRIDHDDADDVLSLFLTAAESLATAYGKRPSDPADARMRAAIILTVAHLYENEGAFAGDKLPPAVLALLSDRVPTIA